MGWTEKVLNTKPELKYKSVPEALEAFALEQETYRNSDEVERFGVETRKGLREATRESAWFKRIYGEAVNRFSVPLSGVDLRQLKGEFSGAIFENMAYHFLLADLDNQTTLLSPQQTFEIYLIQLGLDYTSEKVIQHPFDGWGIIGISVPDGLEVGLIDLQIKRVHEYTTSNKNHHLSRKVTSFWANRQHHQFPPSEAGLTMTLPDGIMIENRRLAKDLKTKHLPITGSQFREFIHHTINHYRSFQPLEEGVASATLMEIQEFARARAGQTAEVATTLVK